MTFENFFFFEKQFKSINLTGTLSTVAEYSSVQPASSFDEEIDKSLSKDEILEYE